ncbi:MAG TPA: hypothetical protein EYO90_00170 [Candidatus Latescibacteria bacterium]|nr:hypothetical protein [Candidatus Latescibacterota bacterium]
MTDQLASPSPLLTTRPSGAPRATPAGFYLAAGRHSGNLALRVTGFMSEDVYTNILGEYELELKRVQS